MRVIQEVKYIFYENDYKDYIKPQLKAKGIKIYRLADFLGISKNHLHKMLKGQIVASADLVITLTKAGVKLPFNDIEMINGRSLAIWQKDIGLLNKN